MSRWSLEGLSKYDLTAQDAVLELVRILANITVYSSSGKKKKVLSEKPAQYIRLENNNDRCGRLRGIQRALFISYNEQK